MLSDFRFRPPLPRAIGVLAALFACVWTAPVTAQDTADPLARPPAGGERAQGPDDNGIPPLPTTTPSPAPVPLPVPTPAPVAPERSVQLDGAATPPRQTAPRAPDVRSAPERAARERSAPHVAPRETPRIADAPAEELPAADAPLVTDATEGGGVPAPTASMTSPDVDLARGAPPVADAATTGDEGSLSGAGWWPLLLAGLAVLVGLGLWWRRRTGASPADLPAPVASEPGERRPTVPPPVEADVTTPPVTAPPQPVAPPSPQSVTSPAPRAEPAVPSAPPPTDAPVPAIADILVSTPLAPPPRVDAGARAKLAAQLTLRDLRTTTDALLAQVELRIANNGTALAEGVLVRILLAQAQSGQEAQFDGFFDGAGGATWQEIEGIEPGDTVTVAGEMSLNLGRVTPLSVQGRDLLIPVLATDVTYHWPDDADAFGQVAAVHVLGVEPGTAGAPLLPLHLDQGARRWHPPGVRATALARLA